MALQCRTCANFNFNEDAINIFESKNVEILEKIELVIGKSLNNDPELPSHICESCLSNLNRAVFEINTFRNRCIKAQIQIQAAQMILLLNSDNGPNDISLNISHEQLKKQIDACFEKIGNMNVDMDDSDEDSIESQEDETASDDSGAEVDNLMIVQHDLDIADDDQDLVAEYENIALDVINPDQNTETGITEADDVDLSNSGKN